MLDILLSLHFLWILVVIMLLSTGMAYACVWLHKQLLYIASGEWLTEHIYCPLAKVLLLMAFAFLLYPLVYISITYSDLLKLFIKQDFLLNMLNILFVASIILAILPLLNHPAIAMPLLSCIALMLIFKHQTMLPQQLQVELIPDLWLSIKLLVLMVLSYLLSRWLTQHLSQWIDYRYNVIGSKSLVSDSSYLILQMPVMLAYGQYLQLQITA